MKITTLIENTRSSENLKREHGLSLLIETDGKKILFDTGQSDKFIDNAKELAIDLNTVDLAVLSHGHYDHGGGINAFLEVNDHAPIYVNKHAFEKHYHKKHYVGLNKDYFNKERIILVDDEFKINENITLRTHNKSNLKYPLNSKDFYTENNREKAPDNFNHEQYLEIIEDSKSILFSGCSHKGILNITDLYSPDILIGGFHLMDVEMNEKGRNHLDDIADELNSYACKFYTCHCTGKDQYAYLKNRMRDHLEYLSTGKEINI